MDEGWIEKIIKKNMPSEKSLEDSEHVEPVYLKSIFANLSNAIK